MRMYNAETFEILHANLFAIFPHHKRLKVVLLKSMKRLTFRKENLLIIATVQAKHDLLFGRISMEKGCIYHCILNNKQYYVYIIVINLLIKIKICAFK